MEQATQMIDLPPPIIGLRTERILRHWLGSGRAVRVPHHAAKALALFFFAAGVQLAPVWGVVEREMEHCGQSKRARQEPAGTGFVAVRLPRQSETITQIFGIRHPSSAVQKTEKQDTGSAATGAKVASPRRGGLNGRLGGPLFGNAGTVLGRTVAGGWGKFNFRPSING